jgi:hypothetical protein
MLKNRLRTIQRASRWLQALLILVTILFVINKINTLMAPTPPDTWTLAGVVFHGTAVTDKIRILWATQLVLGMALSLKVLYHQVRLLGLLSKGELFTEKQVAQVRQIGLTLAFALVIWLAVVVGALPEIVAAQDQWTRVMPSFPGEAIIGSCIFMFAARIMNEGRELRDEHDLVI